MDIEIPFTKMVATGNDFLIVDTCRHPLRPLKTRWPRVAKMMCDRRFGVGADGLLVLERSKNADVKMRVFNPDGSEAEMCGNGARCAARYVVESGKWKVKSQGKQVIIQTKAGLVSAKVNGNQVSMWMPDPKIIDQQKIVSINGRRLLLCVLDTGVPHAVLFVKDLKGQDVVGLGRQLRFHKTFQPRGTNVDFIAKVDDTAIALRTYERGVEGETLACGTGAVAGALAAVALQWVLGRTLAERPAKRSQDQFARLAQRLMIGVHTQSGEILKVSFNVAAGGSLDRDDRVVEANDVILEGGSRVTFTGHFEWKEHR